MGVVRVLVGAVRTAVPDLPPPAKPPMWLRLSDPAVFAKQLRRTGFRDVRVETLARDWEVPSPEGLADNLAAGFSPGLVYIFEGFGPERTRRALDALVAQLREEFGGGGVRLSCEAHVGLGTKCPPHTRRPQTRVREQRRGKRSPPIQSSGHCDRSGRALRRRFC